MRFLQNHRVALIVHPMPSKRKSTEEKFRLKELEPTHYVFGLEENNSAALKNSSDKIGHRERMRTRILTSGANSLADYEILEMLLYAAIPRRDTKPLAKLLISEFGNLANVLSAEPQVLRKIDKVGDAVIATLKVAETLGQKLLRSKVEKKNVLSSWQALQDYCQAVMGDKKIEHFRILFLNNKNHLISDEVQQSGTVNHTAVYPREVVKRALELCATSLILVHNHPSGDTTPSKADIEMTKEILVAAKALNIKIHDHLIVSSEEQTSMKSLGLF
ncbi:DNA repair protein RadC [Sneathiella marina]|uniref:DNA repair protein RadC n=1 Tax=Sneathiella marina TaxID=2950108 RepID=A0ABY4VXY2_9PROT|nr:DNA repair protein RadC [Sneathiella marina]USG59506.1 DNA repair protein RadC [Sneathiella marina]